MAEKLRDQLIGAWELVSYVEKPLKGSPPNYPMGERPMGHFASRDWFKATPEEYPAGGINPLRVLAIP